MVSMTSYNMILFLLLLTIPGSRGQDDDGGNITYCPIDMIYAPDLYNCYHFGIFKTMPEYGGRVLDPCHGYDSQLLWLDSEEEFEWLKTEFAKRPDMDNWMIDLYDTVGDNLVEDYKWRRLSAQVTFTMFHESQPDNKTERCVVMQKALDYQWADVQCGLMVNYVCKLPAGSPNAALGRPTNQSKTYGGYDSSLAVDGQRNPVFAEASCSSTGKTDYPWWSVDLGAPFIVSYVRVVTRGDCCAEEMKDFEVGLSTIPPEEVSPLHRNYTLCGAFDRIAYPGASLMLICEKPVPSRYVYVIIPKYHRTLTLCEVQVHVAAFQNSATGMPAYQSSTAHGASAARATDGNTYNVFGFGSCTHTDPDGRDPWWAVDLGSPKKVAFVQVMNRLDCCSDALHDFEVGLSNDSPDVLSPAERSYLFCGHHEGRVKPGAVGTVACQDPTLEARYVSIVIPGPNQYLTLCEVNVYTVDEEHSFPKNMSIFVLMDSSGSIIDLFGENFLPQEGGFLRKLVYFFTAEYLFREYHVVVHVIPFDIHLRWDQMWKVDLYEYISSHEMLLSTLNDFDGWVEKFLEKAPKERTDLHQVLTELDGKFSLHKSHVVFIVSDFIDMAQFQPDFVSTMNELSESGVQFIAVAMDKQRDDKQIAAIAAAEETHVMLDLRTNLEHKNFVDLLEAIKSHL